VEQSSDLVAGGSERKRPRPDQQVRAANLDCEVGSVPRARVRRVRLRPGRAKGKQIKNSGYNPFSWRGWLDWIAARSATWRLSHGDACSGRLHQITRRKIELVKMKVSTGMWPRRSHVRWTLPAKRNRQGYVAQLL